MAHIDYTPITDPGLQLLEAVSSLDIPWCAKILDQFETTHRSTYQSVQTLQAASTLATTSYHQEVDDDGNVTVLPTKPQYPATIDLINNTRDEDGYSPLMLAFQSPNEHGAIPMIQFLIQQGGNIKTVPQRVRSRIQWERKQKPTCDSFHQNNAKQSFLLPLWEEEMEKKSRGSMALQDRGESGESSTLVPSMNPTNIERERYKQEPIERDGLFYERKTDRGKGK